jgi:cell division protein ZapD
LDEVIGQLEQAFAALNGQPGKAGNALNENEWVVSVRSRIGIPAGTCEFDLPAYYHWQHHSVEQRRNDLSRWASSLWPLAQSVNLLLKLLRDSGSAQKVMANAGQFQQTLPQGRSFQLLRLRIEPALGLIPEISGNRLMVSVRFLRESGEDKLPVVSNEDASFELTLCS